MKKLLVVATLFATIFACSPLFGQAFRYDSFKRGQHELGLLAGYGENHQIPAATKDHLVFDVLKTRYARFNSPTSQSALELCVGKQFEGQHNYSISAVTSYRKYFIQRGSTALSYDLSFGLIHFYEHVQELGTTTNFTEQVGLTFQHATTQNSAFTLEYRFIHASNAGIKLPNIGINSSFLTIGYSWYKD